MRLIIATKNQGKLREIKAILKGVKIKVVSLQQLRRQFRIREDGKTFTDNAIKKAMAVSRYYRNDYIAADDSGLEVEYLGGKPGVFSKRYAGRDATDLKNNRKLLHQLKGTKKSRRAAHFRCCVALVKDSKVIKIFEGKISGLISEEMKGANGFGYDPLFYLCRYQKTVAQLPLSHKNKISHRSKSFNKLKKYLKKTGF